MIDGAIQAIRHGGRMQAWREEDPRSGNPIRM